MHNSVKILTTVFILISNLSYGQLYQSMQQPGYKFERVFPTKVLNVPLGLGARNNITGGQDTGQIRYYKTDSSIYVWSGTQWINQKSSGGSGIVSYSKNATRDSTVILLSDGSRYAANDSTGYCSAISNPKVTWDRLLVFSASAGDYCINNKLYYASQDSVILTPADLILPRKDVIYADTSGIIGVITGVSAADPASPQIDPASQYLLTEVLINAGAITPAGVGNGVIWDENTGTPEWTGSSSGVPVNFNNSTTPYHLTKAADVGALSNKNTITFSGTGYNQQDYNSLRFYIKLKSALSSTANILVAIVTGTTLSSKIILGAATGFSKTIVGQYQNITIDLTAFGVTNYLPINAVKFYMAGSNPDGIYLDYITLQSGIPTPTQGNYVTNIYRIAGTDSVMKVINGVATFAFKDSIGGGGSGSTEYVVQGYGIRVDSSGRVYTVKADSTVMASKPYVDAKDALKQNLVTLTTTGTGASTFNQGTGALNIPVPSSSMVYPGAGIALSTGSAWSTSITDNSANWNTAYTDRNKWDGGATGLIAATGRTSLGATTIGDNLFTLTNPSAITFPRYNADNTVSALSAASFITAIGAEPALGNPGTNGYVLSSTTAGVRSWVANAAGGSGWGLTGNAGTVDGTNFIGTTDNIPFNIKVNNQKAGRIDNTLANTFFGYLSGKSNTTGIQNTANGNSSLYSNTTGNNNTANGVQSLYSNTTGNSNTANGVSALLNNTTGFNNTANGVQSLQSNTTGSYNTANGFQSLQSNTTGFNNTANGFQSLLNNTTGANNTALGYNTGQGITTGSANTILGANVTGLAAALSNNIIITDGNGNQRINVNAAGVTSLFKGADVASAATITATGNLFHVTGTTTITSVSGTLIKAGTTITIIFDGDLTFTGGSNLKLAGNFVTTSDDTITLAYDGTNFYEVARSIN